MKGRHMKIVVLLCCIVTLVGCSLASVSVAPTPTLIIQPTAAPTAIPAGLEGVEVGKVIVKLVEFPTSKDNFLEIDLDGTYMVYYDPSACMEDNPSYMYGRYMSVRHCPINEHNIADGLAKDKAWLKEDLAPFTQYISCIQGWVYLGVDDQGRTAWFVEMFGFPFFCH